MHKEDHTLAAQRSSGRKHEDGLWETAKVIVQALAIAFFVRTFFYQPFNIPSSSMYPTLMVGDYLFVSKLSYGYGKYSFNFSLGFGGKDIISCCPTNFAGRKVLAIGAWATSRMEAMGADQGGLWSARPRRCRS